MATSDFYGIVLQNINTAKRNSIPNPPSGMLIYNTDEPAFQYYDGTQWWSLANIGSFSDAAISALGYVPANAAGQIFGGPISAPSITASTALTASGTALVSGQSTLVGNVGIGKGPTNNALDVAGTINATSVTAASIAGTVVNGQLEQNTTPVYGVNAPASSASSIILTNPVQPVQNIQFSGGGHSLIMPAMNTGTSPPVGWSMTITNVGSYSFTVVAQDGSTSIVTVGVGQTMRLTLLTNNTANGTWESLALGLTTPVPTSQGGTGTTIPVFLHGQCRLNYVSATQIMLVPYNGSNIVIDGTIYGIPSTGVSAANTGVYVEGTANQNLTASTLYYVYLFNNSGTLTIDFSQTGHSTDASAANLGVEIKTGNSTRTLIGMVYMNSSSQFTASAASQCVASWFFRRSRPLNGANTLGAQTTSTSMAELTTAARVEIVTWGDDAVLATCSGEMSNSTANTLVAISVGIDSTTPQAVEPQAQNSGASNANPASASIAGMLGEGAHYITPVGFVGSGTGTFYVNITGIVQS